MKIRIELDEKSVRRIIAAYLQEQVGNHFFSEQNIVIEVKSKQNYKAEWEKADFRVLYEK